MWDARRRIGGANHFLLPQSADNAEPSTRYGDVAVPQLVEALLALGCNERHLQAKLFGGANVVKAFRGADDLLGMQNAQVARELLEAYGIPVVTCDLGGQQGRKVIFQIQDGVAWVKKL
jgi:chemotaxis protein CheD